MSFYKTALTAGIAMFAMFFGSGNLVFPLIIGSQTTDQYLTASIGLMLTGILVPFLGLFSMVLYSGDKDRYFGLLGKYAPFILSLLILSLIGPFGVVPRCILVAYGGFTLIFPDLPLALFSAIFLAMIVWVIWKKSQVVPIIGKILGPFKIGGIVLIISAAIYQSPELISAPLDEPAFNLGIKQGYQTMDLMAAFFFSITIVEYLHSIAKYKTETIKLSIASSFIGAGLIALVYFGFVFLGAHYASSLTEAQPEQYLATIARLTLGKYAVVIVAITIFFSCLATAASLVRLFAEFLRVDIAKKKISWKKSVLVTAAISFALSLTGFSTIIYILGTILTYVYPALIALTIAAILQNYYKIKCAKQLFWITFIANACYSLI